MLIQINLLPGPSRKKMSGGGGGFKLPDVKALVAKIKDPALVARANGAIRQQGPHLRADPVGMTQRNRADSV